jgi:hypothetical protein
MFLRHAVEKLHNEIGAGQSLSVFDDVFGTWTLMPLRAGVALRHNRKARFEREI